MLGVGGRGREVMQTQSSVMNEMGETVSVPEIHSPAARCNADGDKTSSGAQSHVISSRLNPHLSQELYLAQTPGRQMSPIDTNVISEVST